MRRRYDEPWFRLPASIAEDPIIQALPGKAFRAWINLLCLASRSGNWILPPADDAMWCLRLRKRAYDKVIAELISAGLIEVLPNGEMRPRDWQRHLPYGPRLPWDEWAEIRQAVFERDRFTCTYCGASDVILECDHIEPVVLGGSNDMDNLTTACRTCNRSKGSKAISEWRVAA